MGIDIVRGVINNINAANEVVSVIDSMTDYTGTLYLGYPLTFTDDSVITVDALLISKEKGLTAFIFETDDDNAADKQDSLYYQINNALTKYESLRAGRKVAISPNVISIFPRENHLESNDEYMYCDNSTLFNTINNLPSFDDKYYTALCEALQKISSMKPKKKRRNVTKNDSKGNVIKNIEKEIANLDEWQKKAAFEIPDGPQRIRGLAGSGKTVVLALKAAYLHSQYPEWNIAITFYTRSLSQQIKNMITNFSYEFIGDSPNWEKLHVIHSWGTDSETGIYSEYANKCNFTALNYNGAVAKYGRDNAFNGVCSELLNQTIKFDCFETRNDDEIRSMVTDNADVPTIFEYVLGILWYKASERHGKILDYMKLSLDADLLPKTHAAGGEADIVYEYEATDYYPGHTLLLEATLADSTNQRRMEMEPVSRHLGMHLIRTGNMNSYCVFATNYLNINVISDFRSRKTTPFYDPQDYSKSIAGMKIIPLQTSELKKIVSNRKTYKELYPIFETAFSSNLPPHEWYNGNFYNKI